MLIPPACAPAPARRCSDKGAAVRSRALSNLAEVVDTFGSLLSQEPASDQYMVAEAFLHGLCAAQQIKVRSSSGSSSSSSVHIVVAGLHRIWGTAGCTPAACSSTRRCCSQQRNAAMHTAYAALYVSLCCMLACMQR